MPNLLKDIMSLFYPPVCPVCGEEMPEGAVTVCTRCRWEAPLTNFWMQADNPVVRKFWGVVPVENACSFLFFVHGGGFRSMIHDIKYRGSWRQARELGEWFGAEMAQSGLYGGIDLIVPVPLHIRKRLSRGYNQSEYIAEGMARSLGCPVDRNSVIRSRHNPSQAMKSHRERWENVEGIFAVRDTGLSQRKNYNISSKERSAFDEQAISSAADNNSIFSGRDSAVHTDSRLGLFTGKSCSGLSGKSHSKLSGKHLLLVDDVLTTGATITSCAEAILRAVPDCRISIATLSVSKSDIEIA